MKTFKKTLTIIAIASLSAISLTSTANAAAKKITCYKGTQSKVVTTAKCPTGWTTTKPALRPRAELLSDEIEVLNA